MGVVDRLEVIDIDHQQRHGLLVTLGAPQLRDQGLFQVGAVPDPGEAIRGREALKFRIGLLEGLTGLLRGLFGHYLLGDIDQDALPDRRTVREVTGNGLSADPAHLAGHDNAGFTEKALLGGEGLGV